MTRQRKAVDRSRHLDIGEQQDGVVGLLLQQHDRGIAVHRLMTAKAGVLQDQRHVHQDDRDVIDRERERYGRSVHHLYNRLYL